MVERVLIFYDHFYPAWKAGGPVQSLVNLVRQLRNSYAFYIVCKPHEMGTVEPLPGIAADNWLDWEGSARVLYRNYGSQSIISTQQIYEDVKPDVVFINGLFSLHFNLLPLHAAFRYQRKNPAIKIVLSARGMLHPGALSQKGLKKKIFLSLFRKIGWHNKLHWHATDMAELNFVQQQFGSHIRVSVAGNFPNLLPVAAHPTKQPGELHMGTIALISPMKNHLEVIKALKHVKAQIFWHIYGPVKDAAYWQECTAAIAALPPNVQVQYHGPLTPADLPTAMQQFQLFIMPSKSENFGHALLEALSAGKPVLTTTTTPFAQVQTQGAGIAINPDMLQEQIPGAIQYFANCNAAQWQEVSESATRFAASFVDLQQLQQQYQQLFETN